MFHIFIGLFCFIFADNPSNKIRLQSDPCAIFGSVYVTKNRNEANYLIFEEQNEYLSNVRVFKEDNALYADVAGKWYFTDKKGFADFFIYFVPDKATADFSVYFTENEFRAGCR